MKKRILALSVASILASAAVNAVPQYQLDIGGGSYTGADPDAAINESITTDQNIFDLFAYNDAGHNKKEGQTFMSIGLTKTGGGKVTTPGSFGSFKVDATTFDATSDMTLGTPGSLPSHGVYATYFTEIEFNFTNLFSCKYNTEDNAGQGPQAACSNNMVYSMFAIDKTLLNSDYQLHFDLYDSNGKKAPFSHDAQTVACLVDCDDVTITNVPEPTGLMLMGLGLLGFARFAKKLD